MIDRLGRRILYKMVDEKTICYEARFFFMYVLATQAQGWVKFLLSMADYTGLEMGLAHDQCPHGLIRDLKSPFEELAE